MFKKMLLIDQLWHLLLSCLIATLLPYQYLRNLHFFMNNDTESNICLQWEHDSRVTESNQSKSGYVQASINEVSITELSPR